MAHASRNISEVWSSCLKLAKMRPAGGNSCEILCSKAFGSRLLSSLVLISEQVGYNERISWMRPEVNQSFRKSSFFCSSRDCSERLYSLRKSGMYRVNVVAPGPSAKISSFIVASSMVDSCKDELCPEMSSGRGTRAIKIERLKTCTVRTKLSNWGKRRCQNHNGSQQFPNGRAKILTVGTQEVSQKVVPDEKPSPTMQRDSESVELPVLVAYDTVQ
jgi:hypothetical protein